MALQAQIYDYEEELLLDISQSAAIATLGYNVDLLKGTTAH